MAEIYPTKAAAVDLVVLALIAYTIRLVLQWRRLSHIPGPFSANFSKYWVVSQVLKRRQPIAFKEANERYGSLVRVGPNQLITDDPEVMRKFSGTRTRYTRSSWYEALKFDPSRDNLVSMRDDVAHTKMRAKMAAGYSGKENESMEGSIEAVISRLVQLIETKYISTSDSMRIMDWGEKGTFFTLDVISELAFGKAFGYLEQDVDIYNYIARLKRMMPALMITAHVPTVGRILQSRYLRGLLPKESDRLGFGAFIGVAKKIVAQRFGANAMSRRDMLGSFVRHGLTQEEASSEALLQIVAGSDTSATTVKAIMLYILTNPNIYRKLQTEIDTAVATGNISSPIRDSEARQMPYLQAIIKEGLRIMPPAPGHLLKVVPKEGDVVDGKFIPGGTEIGPSILGMQMSKTIYGTDAELFRPERWTEADPEEFARMASTLDLVFNYGKWQCLGKNVALMEFNKVFVELLRRFDISIAMPNKPVKVSILGIWMLDDFWLRVEKREL